MNSKLVVLIGKHQNDAEQNLKKIREMSNKTSEVTPVVRSHPELITVFKYSTTIFDMYFFRT